MFEILRKSLSTGIVTETVSRSGEPPVRGFGRGRPQIDYPNWSDARPATQTCPTGALSYCDQEARRTVVLDLGKCTFCGLCAEADPAISMSRVCEVAARCRDDLITATVYELNADGSHRRLFPGQSDSAPSRNSGAGLETVGAELRSRVQRTLGRSLHIREVDAGSCNGCEVEINGLNSPIYDLERFGIHFVASPRHADLLLVTGPVSRNMELALRKTYDAMPDPRLVVAVGACGCSGGIFGQNYATVGRVDQVIPVDVYVTGCPPNPRALLRGILMAVGRIEREA